MNSSDKTKIINRYMKRFKKYGVDIKTLASGNIERQKIRFKIFSEIGDLNGKTLLDLGCGFGDFYQHLKERNISVKYTGIDICPAFIDVCRERFPEADFMVRDIQKEGFNKKYDYIVSSQVFNGKFEVQDNMDVIKNVLEKCYKNCNVATAFDMMTDYVDFKEDKLYYYSPEKIFSYCKSLTKRVLLRHDYPLFEFVVCLYKDFEGWK